jgi:hypothetical protein
MRPTDSPFPVYWWGTSLENVGLGDVRPWMGTYGRYDFSKLPPVPFEMRGDFAWFAALPVHDEHTIGSRKAAENTESLRALCAYSDRIGPKLPQVFVKFMETPVFHQQIRSNTDCFLDLCAAPIRSPVGGGYLIRFLADSQGCIFWYLYVTPDGSDHSVVASPGYYGTEAEQWQDEEPDPADIVFCAESFEVFMCRFWLENEIWFAEWEKTPIPDVGLAYIEQYRNKR